jgi:hypothetical protein
VGRVYKNPDGTYTATAMTPVGQAGGTLPPISSLPAGTTNAAQIHTHGGNDPGYDNEHFSKQDRDTAASEHVPSYLATPGGTIQRYDPATKTTTVLYAPGGTNP